MSGAHGMEMSPAPLSTTPFTMGAISAASVGGVSPMSGNPSRAKERVKPPMSYMTPLGMPVVPPV